MKTKQTQVHDVVRSLIEDAIGAWQGLDWDNPGTRYDEASVEADADLADGLGGKALVALDRGDYRSAVELLEEARHLELKYGDAPVWGPVAEAADNLACLHRDKTARYIANPWTGAVLPRPWSWTRVEARVIETSHPQAIRDRLLAALEAWVNNDQQELGALLLT